MQEQIEARKREILDKLRLAISQEWWDGVDKLSLAYSRLSTAEARAGEGAGDGVLRKL